MGLLCLKTNRRERRTTHMAYQIPRNVKGEGRILFIFSTKALITTGIGAAIRLVYLVDT